MPIEIPNLNFVALAPSLIVMGAALLVLLLDLAVTDKRVLGYLEFGQSFHENLAAPFLLKCRRRCLADQYDIGNNYLFERFDLIDKPR